MLKAQTAVLFFFTLFWVPYLGAQDNESCFSLELESRSVSSFEPFCIDVRANGFEELLLFQWSIRYDPSVLEFTEVTNFNLPAISSANFGPVFEGPHGASFATAWTSPSFFGTELDSSAVLFSLCFQPLVEAARTYVEFFDEPSPWEIGTDGEGIISLGLISSEISIGEVIEDHLAIEKICIQASDCESLGAAWVEVLMDSRENSFTYHWFGAAEFITDSPIYEVPTPGFYQLEVIGSDGAKARASIHVSESIREKILWSYVEPVPCDQEAGGSISLNLRDTDVEYEFLWSNGETSQSLENLSPGVYTVTITNSATGCKTLEVFRVDTRTLSGAVETTCIGEDFVSVRAFLADIGAEPLTFDWSTGETFTGIFQHEVRIPALENNAYAVTITTEDDCSLVLEGELPDCDSDAEPFTVYDECLVFEIDQVVVEQGEVVCTDVQVKGFKDIISYQYTMTWNPEQLAFREVRDFNLGLSMDNFGLIPSSLEQGRLTTLWIDDADAGGQTLDDGEILYSLCFEVLGESGYAPIQISNHPAAIEVLWARDHPDENTPIPASFIAGGFQIDADLADNPLVTETCVSEIGCGDTGLERVTTIVQGGVTPYTYQWIGPENFSSLSPDFDAPSQGVYFLTVTDASGAQASTTILVKDTDVYPNTTAEITPVSCEAGRDGSIKLVHITDPTAYSFEWAHGETTRDVSYLWVGEYTVTITENARNCKTVERYYVGPENIRATLYYSCVDSLTAEVSASVVSMMEEEYTFSWSNGVVEVDSQLSTIQVVQGETVDVTVTNNRGCTYVSQLITPTCPEPISDNEFTASYAYNCSETGQGARITAYVWGNAQGPYTYAWSTGLVEEDVNTSSILIPTNSVYSVTITDALGSVEVLGGIVADCSGPEPLILSIGEANAGTDESVCLAVRAENFSNILGLQYAVGWNAELLELTSLQNFSLPDLDESHFNFGATNYMNGSVNLSWFDPSGFGVSLANDALLYEMCFDVTGEDGEVAVFFDQESLQLEVVNEDVESVIPSFKDGLVIINGEERVWPGDTDNNEVANHYDLLNIGLAYGAVGPIREEADLIWRGQVASDWNTTTPDTGVDFKHIDSNGDGVIDVLDTTAISLNWGRAVNLMPNPLEEYRSSSSAPKTTGAPIFIEALPVQPGETVSFNVHLGDDDNPVIGAYGLAFSIVYDPLAVVYGSASASFENSWLGELGADMIALDRDDPNQHRLHIALTRIDQVEVDGSGVIGQISMTIEDVIFRDTEYEMPFRVENVRLIRSDEEEVQVVQKQTIGTITDTPLSSEEVLLASRIQLFPNPTRDLVHVMYGAVKIDRIQLLDLQGRLLSEYRSTDQISLQGLPSNTYLLRFVGPAGVALKKLVKH